MLVTLALSSTAPDPWLPVLSSLTVMSARFQPYWERIGPSTSSTSLVCLAFTPMLFLLGSSSLNNTLGSTLTSLQPRLEQSSDRSRGLSLPVMKASKEVNLRPLLSRSRVTRDLIVSPLGVDTTVVARSGRMNLVRLQASLSQVSLVWFRGSVLSAALALDLSAFISMLLMLCRLLSPEFCPVSFLIKPTGLLSVDRFGSARSFDFDLLRMLPQGRR